MAPPATHARSSSDSDGSVAAIVPGVRKIAEPMTLVMTRNVASRRPIARTSRDSLATVSAGTASARVTAVSYSTYATSYNRPMAISLTVNGRAHTVDVDPATPLLYVLSDDLGLRGPK